IIVCAVQVDPCVDFFEFVCGNWKAKHPILGDRTSYSQFDILSDKVLAEMRVITVLRNEFASIQYNVVHNGHSRGAHPNLIRGPEFQQRNPIFESKELSSSKSAAAVKAIYRKCMEKHELNRIGARKLIETIRSYGEWPMLGRNRWRVDQFDLTTLLSSIAAVRGAHIFITNNVRPDYKNVSRSLIHVRELILFELFKGKSYASQSFDQGKLSLGDSTRDYYLDREKHGKIIAAYRQFLINKVTLFNEDVGLPISERKIASDVDEIIDLETELAKILVAEEDRRNYTRKYNLLRLNEMQALMPLVDWTRYFHSIAPPTIKNYLADDPQVLVREIDYMKRVADLINSTDPRIITNYAYIRYSSSWLSELGERYESVAQEFYHVVYGRKKKVPRWKDCTSRTMRQMQYAAGALYVRKAFDETLKNLTLEIVDDLQDAFYNMVAGNGWMDETTKARALDKVRHLLRQTGYPDFILDDEKLDDYYSELRIEESDSYSQMVEKLTRWKIEFDFKRLIKPVDRNEFDFNPAEVNAFYWFTALSYAGIGTLIGHEITHGFDDEGRQFDAVGNLRDWWDGKAKASFERRAQCIVDQYSKIKVPEVSVHLNGKLTQGENIADNGAVKQAFKAYKNYRKKWGEEKRIKGLENYNNEQMFFMGYARIWCGHSTRDKLVNRILSDPHAPEKYRVNQVLANQPEFAAAFNCPVGAPMNPTERCTVW
uniref:Neprilysin n=1 Tax=Angiostrongylus costaricensis TaxID=334426 RepID=A0A0R3PFX8_ANGCS